MATPTTPAAAPGETQGLRRQIGLWSAVAVVIGTTIGSGIFRSPAAVADRVEGPLPMLAIWVVAGLFAMCGALTLAEVSGAYPHTGGLYVFIERAWGRLAAFVFGWAELAVIRAAALGAISTTFAEYFLRVVHPPSAGSDTVHYVAAVAIVVVASINIRGVRLSSAAMNVTAIAKYAGLLFIVALALAIGLPRTGGHFTPAMPAEPVAMSAFGLALVSVLWAYDGWADLTFISGEVRDPRRNMPRALIIGAAGIILIYLLANVAYLSVLSIEEIRVSKLVAADAAARLVGGAGVAFVGVTVMISTFGTLNGSMLTAPRIFFAMAEDGLIFRKLGEVHPKWGTPWVATAMTAVLGVIFVLVRSFEQLADAFVTGIVPFYALAVSSIFVFRRRPDYSPPFRTPGYPVVPALFLLAVVYLLANALWNPESRWATAGTLGGILLGVPIYYLTVGRR